VPIPALAASITLSLSIPSAILTSNRSTFRSFPRFKGQGQHHVTLVADLSETSRRLVCDQTLSATRRLCRRPGSATRVSDKVWSGRVGSGWVAVVGFSLNNTETFWWNWKNTSDDQSLNFLHCWLRLHLAEIIKRFFVYMQLSYTERECSAVRTEYRSAGVGKRVCSKSLYHPRQCGVVLKPRSGRTLCFRTVIWNYYNTWWNLRVIPWVA